MYSIVDLDYLQHYVTRHIHPKYKKHLVTLFDINHIYQPCKQVNAISLCLFCQRPDNKIKDPPINEYSLSYRDKTSHWYVKYYKSLIQFIKDFNKSKYYKTFKIRLYLENKLKRFIPQLLKLSNHLEIYYMKTNSIGAQPGTLWRFLAFDDKRLNIVFSSDVDELFNNHITNMLDYFILDKMTIGRVIGYPIHGFRIDKCDINSPLNYTPCQAGTLVVRPKKINISIKNTIINYILYRVDRIKSNKPWEEYDDKNTELYNKPIGDHLYGWGGNWTMYGFDEKIWKHTLFPYFVKRGEVFTRACHNFDQLILDLPPDHCIMIDYNFIKQYGNKITCF